MSHIVTITTQIRDPVAIAAACRRLHLKAPAEEEVELFASRITGWSIRLPGWRYPIVADLQAGTLQYDNYEGRWGQQRELDKFMQAYAVEKAMLEARRRGHRVAEQLLADGSIQLTIQAEGGAA